MTNAKMLCDASECNELTNNKAIMVRNAETKLLASVPYLCDKCSEKLGKGEALTLKDGLKVVK